MSANRPKTINALMAYMRNKKHIAIEGSTQKRKLRYIGYFHGYKGYRFCGKPNNLLKYNSFNELQAVYNYDMSLKSLLYSKIMFLETTTKNYALEIVLKRAGSKRFADVYSKLLTGYKSYPVGTKPYKDAINKRMGVRNKVYSTISRDYGKRFVVNHYYDKDQPLPIWAIFELLGLGEFGNFVDCLNRDTAKRISASVGINADNDDNGKMLPSIVYTLKDLRNAVAHNNTVFDTRFKTGRISKKLSDYLCTETGIEEISFKSIADYVILISFMLKILERPNKQIVSFIREFERNYEDLRNKVSPSIYNTIIYTDTRKKMALLKDFLRKH